MNIVHQTLHQTCTVSRPLLSPISCGPGGMQTLNVMSSWNKVGGGCRASDKRQLRKESAKSTNSPTWGAPPARGCHVPMPGQDLRSSPPLLHGLFVPFPPAPRSLSAAFPHPFSNLRRTCPTLSLSRPCPHPIPMRRHLPGVGCTTRAVFCVVSRVPISFQDIDAGRTHTPDPGGVRDSGPLSSVH